ncbi:MAG: ComEC/Rec2 family competence protein, partial [Romboutsia sp.]|nr:ComEC/Rec2 family competence protein [Romboutsia sp.]
MIQVSHKANNRIRALIKLNNNKQYVKTTMMNIVCEVDTIIGRVEVHNIPKPCLTEAKDVRYKEFFDNVVAYVNFTEYRIISSNEQMKIDQYINHHFDITNQQVLQALLFGKSHTIFPTTRNAFSKSGISHLLAISGLHIGIITTFFFFLFRIILSVFLFTYLNKVNINLISKMCALIMLTFYLTQINISISSIRAAIMLLIPYLSLLKYKTANKQILWLTMFIMLLIWPESILYPSFQFSFITVFSLLYLPNLNIKSGILKTTYSTFTACIAVFPLIMYWFNEISIQPFLANIICIPITVCLIPLVILWFLFLKIGVH